YNVNGIYPTYISIQNEPDFSASWESCLLRPSETINSSDTIAGYNKALNAVSDTIVQRDSVPRFLGPECVGIGYNAVENYINALDDSKIYGIAHHLYHGAESGTVENDPFTSTNYKKVGNFHPEIPHFQTEYSRAGWFTVAGMMFQSLSEESVAAYLYWDLIWTNGGGLVNLDFPWDRNQWNNSKGYSRTKDFYVFKQFSAYIHPGWQRVKSSYSSSNIKTMAFLSADSDSATFVAINRSETVERTIQLSVPGYNIDSIEAYRTSENENGIQIENISDEKIILPPRSITTVTMDISVLNTALQDNKNIENSGMFSVFNYPNPFSESTNFQFSLKEETQILLTVFDNQGRILIQKDAGFFQPGNNKIIFSRNGLNTGLYFYKLKNSRGDFGIGRFVIKN
ncbi:MAG: T9SS type A sorting domain-containing protein, partial [Mariniphaga sp.]|nr:T9SS type A sorting domain-containing protein [Mariniphaga sp.]